ncbi:VWA domain-containing protein [Pseudenhygromyxa sp. WMMC2535]|uniref:vWA domain-containing protein n=1 Tax=Pseudenhygromyxa sp. WMMC2535 TaxID=2712867 RepID=UPI001552B047|nr:vWA domain-containing protein [Pseudenhygromyxa sp. WMMC2535]NVB40278.1 VWA domain-containing protein [Pseudenhygromyxa sp. WMMC2535]
MTSRRIALALSSLTSLAALTACNPHPLKPTEFDGSSEAVTGLPLDVNKRVDVLLVVDNSGSMGEEQANLAANFGPFIEELEAVGADYRIGITTTDLGGRNCVSESNGGDLILSSCLDRPETFVFGSDDQYAAACESHCALSDAQLEIQPSADDAGETAVRPWIESYNGVSNLPEGVDPLAAFQCFAPQGISGCGWESPLEAMSQALENMHNPERPEYGFLRDDALLAILVITDEADCSFNSAHSTALFDSEVFYSEGANYATSAVCWNAGTACEGDSPYSSCIDVDRDESGAETDVAADAVLYPVSGYVEQLAAEAASKSAGREVLVSVIAGVPLDYAGGELVYADDPDADQQELFGIGPGCSNTVGDTVQTAIPPVRLKTFAEAFAGDGVNLYSVCDDDYRPAVVDMVASLIRELPPACLDGCALDVDESTEALDYSCTVTQEVGSDRVTLPECEASGGEYVLPEGADACWIAKSGDALSEECMVAGRNLEFELVRRSGVSVPGDVEVKAACELSSFPSIDCPG